ncbi:MAG: retropepsin-like aspartic protease [Chloroflexi bacterium]|nr:retropepsin-like aspartic protease [Chloroflexota bacterium]
MSEANCGFESAYELVIAGPTLAVQIGFDEHFEPERGAPNLPSIGHPALIDTGALESCIDARLAATLDLPVVDEILVSGASGEFTAKRHLAQIHVAALDYTVHGLFSAVHLLDGGQTHAALLGRTFLSRVRLLYDGPSGRVTLATT